MEEITEIILLNYESSFLNESKKILSHNLYKSDGESPSFTDSLVLINFSLNYVC